MAAIPHHLFLWIDASLLVYFLLLNGFYAVILLLGFPVLFKRSIELGAKDLDELLHFEHLPPVTVMIPAFNEREIIEQTIASLFHLDYPHYQIMIINDGSTDDMLEILKKKYELALTYPAFTEKIKTEPIKGVYRSKKFPNLMVIDKERGAKEDALNAGLNACTTPFYFATDADAILEPDAVSRLVLSFLTQPNTVGLGGGLRIANGCRIEDGLITAIHLPKKYFAKMQIVEYLRSFFFGRLGWNILGGPFILCGVFSFLEKKAALLTGGYKLNVPAEDLDMTLRIHGKMHEEKRKYHIGYVADAAVWTEVPEEYKSLSLQRRRWYCSALDICWRYKYMIFHPKYGRVGFLYIPYLLFGESLAPLVEFFAYFYIVATFFLGVLNFDFFILFLLISLGYSMLLSLVSLGMEQSTFKKYVTTKEVMKIVGYTLLESLGYRQLSVWWRVQGFFRYIFTPKKRIYRERVKRYARNR